MSIAALQESPNHNMANAIVGIVRTKIGSERQTTVSMNMERSQRFSMKLTQLTGSNVCFCNYGSPCLCGSRKEPSDPRSHYNGNTKTYSHSLRSKNKLTSRLCENNLAVFTNGHHKPFQRLNDVTQTSGIAYRIPYLQSTAGLGLPTPHNSVDHDTTGAERNETSPQQRRLTDTGFTSTPGGLYLNTAEANSFYRNSLLTTTLSPSGSNVVNDAQSHNVYVGMPDSGVPSSDAGSYIHNWQLQNRSPDSFSTQWPFSASTISSGGSMAGQGFPISPNDDFVLSPDGGPSSSSLAERPWSAVDVPEVATSADVIFTQSGGLSIDTHEYNLAAFSHSSTSQPESNDTHPQVNHNFSSAPTGNFNWENLSEIRQAHALQANRSAAPNEDFIPVTSGNMPNSHHLIESSYSGTSILDYPTDDCTYPELGRFIMPQVQQMAASDTCSSLLVQPDDGNSSFDSPIVTDSPVSSNTFSTPCPLAAPTESGSEMWDSMISGMPSRSATNYSDERIVPAPLDSVNDDTTLNGVPSWVD